MTILDKLRRRVADRERDAVGRYWSLLRKAAIGDLGTQDADSAVADLEAAAASLGRSTDDVAEDLEQLRTLLDLDCGDLAAQQQRALADRQRADGEVAAADRAIEAATAHRDRCGEALQAAIANLLGATERVRVVDAQRSRLAGRGCPVDAMRPRTPVATPKGKAVRS